MGLTITHSRSTKAQCVSTDLINTPAARRGRHPDKATTMQRFYIEHLLCAVLDHHFESRLDNAAPAPTDTLTVSVAELLNALREAFEVGQDVRRSTR